MAQANPIDRLLAFEAPVRFLLELLLVAALALLLARFAWLIVAPQASVADYRERPLPTLASSRIVTAEADLTLLVRSNPFEGAGTLDDTPIDVPETQLNLVLDGLLMSTLDRNSSATIRTPNNQQKRFTVGEEVLPGVTLERILSDRVILNRNGIDETLLLGRRSAGLSVISDGSVPRAIVDVEPAPRSINITGPDVLLRTISLSEARSEGRTIGYRIEARGDVADLQALGFQPGDVLIAVNGREVALLDTDEMLSVMGATSAASLEIDRAGQPVQVIIEFEE
jgi:general secretion pathway protein C